MYEIEQKYLNLKDKCKCWRIQFLHNYILAYKLPCVFDVFKGLGHRGQGQPVSSTTGVTFLSLASHPRLFREPTGIHEQRRNEESPRGNCWGGKFSLSFRSAVH